MQMYSEKKMPNRVAYVLVAISELMPLDDFYECKDIKKILEDNLVLCTVEAVRNHMRVLEEFGYLKVEQFIRGNKPCNRYKVVMNLEDYVDELRYKDRRPCYISRVAKEPEDESGARQKIVMPLLTMRLGNEIYLDNQFKLGEQLCRV